VIFERVSRFLAPLGRLFPGRRIIGSARAARVDASSYVNRIVSDAILLNEIPSPTEREAARAQHVQQRLIELGYPGCTIDEYGNVSAFLPARENVEEYVLLFADIRCEDYSPIESMTKLEPDRLRGRGIAENSIAAAALLILAEYLAGNEIQYDRSVMFLFTSFDPGEREPQPLERFLQDWKDRVPFAAHLRGLELGGLEDRPLGTCKLSVSVRTEEREAAGKEPPASAIWVLASIASRLGSIRWDTENKTFLNIARVDAGVGFGWPATEGVLELEVFSQSANALEMARKAVEATIGSIAGESGAAVETRVKAFLPAGDPEINAGLNAIVRGVHDRLRIKTRPVSLPGYVSFLNSLGIPSVSLGITTGRKSYGEEYVDIRPIETGFRQLLAFLDDCAGWREGKRS
jgi:tripeptide aminopeptidase